MNRVHSPHSMMRTRPISHFPLAHQPSHTCRFALPVGENAKCRTHFGEQIIQLLQVDALAGGQELHVALQKFIGAATDG